MRILPLVVALPVVGCAVSAVPTGDAVAGAIAGRAAGKAQSCISLQASEGLRVIDSETLAYGSGSTIYINRLGGRCPGLRDWSTIVTEVHGGQYCRGDLIRALEPGSTLPGPACILGDWVPYRR